MCVCVCVYVCMCMCVCVYVYAGGPVDGLGSGAVLWREYKTSVCVILTNNA